MGMGWAHVSPGLQGTYPPQGARAGCNGGRS